MTEQEAIAHVQAIWGDKYKVSSTPRYEGCEINIGPAVPEYHGRHLFAPSCMVGGQRLERPDIGPLGNNPWHYCWYGDTWEDAALRPHATIGQYMFNADALIDPPA